MWQLVKSNLCPSLLLKSPQDTWNLRHHGPYHFFVYIYKPQNLKKKKKHLKLQNIRKKIKIRETKTLLYQLFFLWRLR
jgi:hypothetical protein